MGNRALVIFKEVNAWGNKGTDYSPVVYLHWDGYRVKQFLKELKTLMSDRPNDASYACARFVGICHSKIEGNLSLGIQSAPEDIESYKPRHFKEMSNGDNGVYVVDCRDFTVKNYR